MGERSLAEDGRRVIQQTNTRKGIKEKRKRGGPLLKKYLGAEQRKKKMGHQRRAYERRGGKNRGQGPYWEK